MRWLSPSMVKRILRWLLLGGILFFLAKTLKDHWQEVRTLQITGATVALLTIALGITLIAHIWSGWVWHLILQTIGQPRDSRWSTVVYLKTNIAKYLPGNVWHFYGRVRALQATGASTGAAIVGVLLEPLLMAAAALGLAAVSFSITVSNDWRLLILSVGALVVMLVAIHPRFLNPLLRKLGKAKAQAQGMTVITSTLRLQAYPWRSLLGELGFVLLRGLGFMMTIVALQAFQPSLFFPILGAFSVAWLLGLVIPGAPGGVGVFEAVAIALLSNHLSSGLLLTSVALYRLISTLAEALGAGLIWLEERITQLMKPVAKARRRLLLMPATEADLHSPEEQDSEAPETVQPETVQPETVQPETVQPETVQPEAVYPDISEPEVPEPVMSKPEMSESSEPEISESEIPESDIPKSDTSEPIDTAPYSASLSSTNKN